MTNQAIALEKVSTGFSFQVIARALPIDVFPFPVDA
jgi:hypothetical protein